MSDYRKSEITAALDSGRKVNAPFYRLWVAGDGADTASKYLNITEAELVAIRDLLACQHESGAYLTYKGETADGPFELVATSCNDCNEPITYTCHT